jgi:tryptophan 2,3-dioxygenase
MELTYASYLQIERLLGLQQPQSDPAEHDETLFIIIHQVYELWFKQLLHEFEKIKRDFTAGDTFGALHTFKRCRTIMKTLVAQLDILETMTPISFSAFRDRLDRASGFQSLQFREFEFMLGYKRKEALAYYADDMPGIDRVRRRLAERSVVDHFYDFAERHGVAIPDVVRNKDPEDPTEPNVTVQEGLFKLFTSQPELAILFELMMDFDEGQQEWRYRHVKLVERTIGNKSGTGGSLGVDFLKKSLFKAVFPDLWAIRHRM